MKLVQIGVGLLAVVSTACGGNSAPPEHAQGDVQCPDGQRFDGQYCVATESSPGGAAVESEPKKPEDVAVSPSEPAPVEKPVEAIPAEPVTTPPEGTPATEEKSLAAPVDVSMAAAAAPLVQYLASAHLPAGARQFGSAFAGQFNEGQILEQRVQLSVGKCYTVVAAGTPPVEELNIELYLAEGDAALPLAEDKDRGPQAVLGRKNECFKPTAGQTNLKLVLTVEKGRGVAAAQVFEK